MGLGSRESEASQSTSGGASAGTRSNKQSAGMADRELAAKAPVGLPVKLTSWQAIAIRQQAQSDGEGTQAHGKQQQSRHQLADGGH